MGKDFIDKEDHYDEKDYRVVMRNFSTSLRGKVITIFATYFIILAAFIIINIYVYFPSASNKYENVVSNNHIRNLIEEINYKLTTSMVKQQHFSIVNSYIPIFLNIIYTILLFIINIFIFKGTFIHNV